MNQMVVATFYIEGSPEFQAHYYEAHLKPAMDALKLRLIGGVRRATVLNGTVCMFGFDRQIDETNDPVTLSEASVGS